MGNTVIKTKSDFGDDTSYKRGGDSEVEGTQTLSIQQLSTLSDISPCCEDAVSIITDSTSSTTDYESTDENDAKHMSSGTDIFCDIPLDTKPSKIPSNSSLSNDWGTTPENPADQSHLLLVPLPLVNLAENSSTISTDHHFVVDKNVIVQQQLVNIQALDRENQLLRSSDRGRSKVGWRENSRLRTKIFKKCAKQNRHVEQSKKKSAHKRVVQRSPVVHNDFFIFSYDHVFNEVPAEEVLVSSSYKNQFQQIGHALSDTINKISQLLDDAECGKGPSMVLPHLMWTRFLNRRATYAPFFEFNVFNVHLFRGIEKPLHRFDAAEVRLFFAGQAYLDLLAGVEFSMKEHAHRLLYVVDMSKREVVLEDLSLVDSFMVGAYYCPPKVIENSFSPANFVNVPQLTTKHDEMRVVSAECVASTEVIPSAGLIVDTSKSVSKLDNKRTSLTSANEYIKNRLHGTECVIDAPDRISKVESIAVLPEKHTNFATVTDAFVDQLLFVRNESVSIQEDSHSNATSLELVDDRCSSFAEETDEFDSCVESVDGGPVSEGWSDMCSMPSENSFAVSSLRSEILECAFQLDSINSETMNCNENVSEAGPATAADLENINNIPFLNDSSELDYISKLGGTGLVAENLRKQSLYVKFDPLVAADIDSHPPNGDVTLKLEDTLDSSKHESCNDVSVRTQNEEKRCSTDVSESLSCENGSVGKLISVTPNRSPRKITPRSSPRFIETDPDDVSKLQSLLLKQMKKEEAFKEEIECCKRDNDQMLQKLQSAEKEIAHLKSELENTQENEKKLKNDLKERIKSKQQLSVVMGEYEKTISQMLTKRDEEKKEYEATFKKLETDRDSAVQHLNNLENAFNDIHQKYERGKAVNEALKKNEELLQKSINEYETTVKTVENKYELLKSHATSQLEKANQELELITQSYEKEQAKLKAMLRKSEIQINSLQNALDRKTKENQELTAICDELIVKLSTHSNS